MDYAKHEFSGTMVSAADAWKDRLDGSPRYGWPEFLCPTCGHEVHLRYWSRRGPGWAHNPHGPPCSNRVEADGTASGGGGWLDVEPRETQIAKILAQEGLVVPTVSAYHLDLWVVRFLARVQVESPRLPSSAGWAVSLLTRPSYVALLRAECSSILKRGDSVENPPDASVVFGRVCDSVARRRWAGVIRSAPLAYSRAACALGGRCELVYWRDYLGRPYLSRDDALCDVVWTRRASWVCLGVSGEAVVELSAVSSLDNCRVSILLDDIGVEIEALVDEAIVVSSADKLRSDVFRRPLLYVMPHLGSGNVAGSGLTGARCA